MSQRDKTTLQEKDGQLILVESFHRKTVQGELLVILFSAALVVTCIIAVVGNLLDFLINFSLPKLGEFIVAIVWGLIPIALAAGLLSSGISSEKRLVFDKNSNQFRSESQAYFYQFKQGEPKCLQTIELSTIGNVNTGCNAIKTNMYGVSRTVRLDSIDIYLKSSSQPFLSMALTKTLGKNPYKNSISPTEIVSKIREFLDLNAG
jgi:translation initiation factor 2 beta subunit (eIF-2beta)/eIF-5